MAPLTKDSDTSAQAGGTKPQPVAVEIPVTVNGVSTTNGSDKREPFSESTQTVLVFGSGAVIRLATPVGPGQLLFVTNEKSRKEVVCQVVKSKQNGGAGGYVELKFTEAAADFWGMRFPSGPAAPAPSAPVRPAAPAGLLKSLEQKLEEVRSQASLTPPDTLGTPKPLVKPVAVLEPVAVATAESAPRDEAAKSRASVASAEPQTRTRVPTLSEFLTQGSNGPELKAPDRSEAPARTVAAVEDLVLPSGEKEAKPGLGAALGVSLSSTAATATFDLAAEEVKIPSWLEPLARNSASPVEGKAEAASMESRDLSESHEGDTAADSQDQKGILTLTAEGRAPNFGSSLPLGASADQAKSSGKGWKIAFFILALLLAAAAGWYWYVNHPAKVSASGNRDAAGFEAIPAPVPASPDSEPREANAANPAASQSFDQPAAVSPAGGIAASLPRAALNGGKAKRADAAVDSPAEEPVRKPAFGNVQLAAPVVARSASSEDNTAADPGLSLNGTPSGDPGSLSMLASKDKQPAAPRTIGGDVIPARLLSSVPPVYPQLARTQRISGGVVVDALIDEYGHVSETKVISGPALLHQAAMDAVKKWKYQPATLNGQATSMHLIVTVQFHLQ